MKVGNVEDVTNGIYTSGGVHKVSPYASVPGIAGPSARTMCFGVDCGVTRWARGGRPAWLRSRSCCRVLEEEEEEAVWNPCHHPTSYTCGVIDVLIVPCRVYVFLCT